MSWQAFVDTQLLVKTTTAGEVHNCVESGALLSAADASAWAATPNFTLRTYSVTVTEEDEVTTTNINYSEPAAVLHLFAQAGAAINDAGIRINGEKYYLVSYDAEKQTIYLKKNAGGACLARTNQAIVFASWNGGQSTTGAETTPQNPGLCNQVTEKLADYLKSIGY
jgi:profilin